MSFEKIFFDRKNLEPLYKTIQNFILQEEEYQINIPDFIKHYHQICRLSYDSRPDLIKKKDIHSLNQVIFQNVFAFIQNYKKFVSKKTTDIPDTKKQEQKHFEQSRSNEIVPTKQDTISTEDEKQSVSSYESSIDPQESKIENILNEIYSSSNLKQTKKPTTKEKKERHNQIPVQKEQTKEHLEKELEKIKLNTANLKAELEYIKKKQKEKKEILLPLEDTVFQQECDEFYIKQWFLDCYPYNINKNNNVLCLSTDEEEIKIVIPCDYYDSLDKLLFTIKNKVKEKLFFDIHIEDHYITFTSNKDWKPINTPLWNLLGIKNKEYDLNLCFKSEEKHKFYNNYFYLYCPQIKEDQPVAIFSPSDNKNLLSTIKFKKTKRFEFLNFYLSFSYQKLSDIQENVLSFKKSPVLHLELN